MKIISLWGAVVVVAIIAVLGLFSPNAQPNKQIVGAVNPYSTNYTAIGLGIQDSYVVTSAQRDSMVASSNIPCSFLTPNATTSLVFASIKLNQGTIATTTKFVLATAATASATTTVLYTSSQITANTGLEYATGSAMTVLSPNTYVNVGVISSSSAALSTIGGSCEAQFITL